jgi:hypothetical protein
LFPSEVMKAAGSSSLCDLITRSTLPPITDNRCQSCFSILE